MFLPRASLPLLGTVLLISLTACYGPDPYPEPYPYPTAGQPYPGGSQNYPAYGQPTYGGSYTPAPAPAPATPRPPAQSDYLPHLSQEYRNGWDIGARDRQTGYPRDYRRAYERFGRGYESYFQEGYEDGYSGQPIRH